MKLKITTLIVTVLAMFQIGGVQKSHAAAPVAKDTDKTSFETTSHGCGCGCASCSTVLEQPAQR